MLMHYIAGDPALFTNEQGECQSHPEDRKYLCHFHPFNEILMRLYEIVEKGKKQDLTPFSSQLASLRLPALLLPRIPLARRRLYG